MRLRGDHDADITTQEVNQLASEKFVARLKKVGLPIYHDLGTVHQRSIKNEGKIDKMKMFDSSYFLGKMFLCDHDIQNMLPYST